MALRFASLGSGSSGNGLVVEQGATRVLMDCGFSLGECTARLARLGLGPADLTRDRRHARAHRPPRRRGAFREAQRHSGPSDQGHGAFAPLDFPATLVRFSTRTRPSPWTACWSTPSRCPTTRASRCSTSSRMARRGSPWSPTWACPPRTWRRSSRVATRSCWSATTTRDARQGNVPADAEGAHLRVASGISTTRPRRRSSRASTAAGSSTSWPRTSRRKTTGRNSRCARSQGAGLRGVLGRRFHAGRRLRLAQCLTRCQTPQRKSRPSGRLFLAAKRDYFFGASAGFASAFGASAGLAASAFGASAGFAASAPAAGAAAGASGGFGASAGFGASTLGAGAGAGASASCRRRRRRQRGGLRGDRRFSFYGSLWLGRVMCHVAWASADAAAQYMTRAELEANAKCYHK